MLYPLFILKGCLTAVTDIARSVKPCIKELSRQENFCNVHVNVFDPCEIEYLRRYCLKKHCINTLTRADDKISLLANPETHTGYRYGASDVWKHIYAISDDLFYRKIVNGLKFSIFVHICRYYVKIDGKYFVNTSFFFKHFRKADYEDFLWLLRLIYSAFAKLDLSKLKLEEKERQLVTQMKNILNINDKQVLNTRLINNIHVCLDVVNCVSCDKCKLWGKIQFAGLITAIKIHNNTFDNKFDEFVFLVNLMTRLTVTANATSRFFDHRKR